MTTRPPLSADRIAQYRDYVAPLIAEARADTASPRAALGSARAAAEAICKHFYELHVGDPGKLMLDELLTRLGQQRLLPPRVATAMRTVQAFGNLGAHAQPDLVATAADDVGPARAALAIIVPWYERDVVGTALAATAPAGAPRRRQTALIAGIAVAALAAGAVVVIVVGDRGEPPARAAEVVADAAPTGAPPPVTTPTPGPAPAPRPPAAAPITVDLTVWRGKTALAPGARLRTGDRLAFELRVSAPAHVYMLQRIDGDLDVLFPFEGSELANPLAAGGAVRIPSGDQLFELTDDGTFGPATVIVIASPTPLDQLDLLDVTLAGQTGEVRRKTIERTEAVVAALGEAPPGAGDGHLHPRGRLELVDKQASSRVSVRYTQRPEDPVVVALFEYVHRR